MKNLISTLAIVSLSFGMVSCGGGQSEEPKEKTFEEKLKENPLGVVQEFQKEMEKAEKEMGGEFTPSEPIHYTDLQKYLPKTIEGYKMEDPEGTTLSMEGFSISSAETEYTSESGDYVRVTIMDYAAAPSLFQVSTAMWNMGITIDSSDEYAKAFSLSDDVNGWESFDKKNNKATVIGSVGQRLLISVEANNQTNVDKVKEVLASMNIKSMMIVINKMK